MPLLRWPTCWPLLRRPPFWWLLLGRRRFEAKAIWREARGAVYEVVAGVERLVRNEILGGKTPADFYRSLDWIYGYGRDAAGP